MFQDLAKLKDTEDWDSEEEEDDATQDYTPLADQTLADCLVNELPESPPPKPDKKRAAKSVNDVADASPLKCAKLDKALGDDEKSIQDKPSEVGDAKTSNDDTPITKVTSAPKEADNSAIMESLTCIVCQELLHDCISLQPCMHSFCAGCYSEWMEKSEDCPSCRTKVERINKNHLVNNLVEAFLKGHPEHTRPDEDIKELDAKNKITRDMLYPGKTHASLGSGSQYSDEEEEDEEGEEEENEEDNATPLPFPNFINPAPIPNVGTLFGAGTPVFGARPAFIQCRQCPGFSLSPLGQQMANRIEQIRRNAEQARVDATTNAGPSTSGVSDPQSLLDDDVKQLPAIVPMAACLPQTDHVLCLCCLQPMPDYRIQYRAYLGNNPQQCQVCFRAFCHAFWGCLRPDCLGCLGNFQDMNFGKKCLAGLILDNAYESEVFKDYLEAKGLSVKKLLAECIEGVNSGKFAFQDPNRLPRGVQTPVCYNCGLQAFKELAYQYRLAIPQDQFPAEVVSRPNCYWGKNCRTQKNKLEHAQRYNHVCDQVRTML